MESIIRHFQVDSHDCYFWRTHEQAELDLLIFKNGQRLGFEFKFTKTPKLTKAMQIASTDLKLDQLIVIYPGQVTIKLTKQINCYGLESFLKSND